MLRIDRVDRALRRVVVYPAAAAGAARVEKGPGAEERARWRQAVRGVFETGRSRLLTVERETADGPRCREVRFVPEATAAEAVGAVLVITRDVTPPPEGRDALAASERRPTRW